MTEFNDRRERALLRKLEKDNAALIKYVRILEHLSLKHWGAFEDCKDARAELLNQLQNSVKSETDLKARLDARARAIDRYTHRVRQRMEGLAQKLEIARLAIYVLVLAEALTAAALIYVRLS